MELEYDDTTYPSQFKIDGKLKTTSKQLLIPSSIKMIEELSQKYFKNDSNHFFEFCKLAITMFGSTNVKIKLNEEALTMNEMTKENQEFVIQELQDEEISYPVYNQYHQYFMKAKDVQLMEEFLRENIHDYTISRMKGYNHIKYKLETYLLNEKYTIYAISDNLFKEAPLIYETMDILNKTPLLSVLTNPINHQDFQNALFDFILKPKQEQKIIASIDLADYCIPF